MHPRGCLPKSSEADKAGLLRSGQSLVHQIKGGCEMDGGSRLRVGVSLALSAAVLVAGMVWAEIPKKINYQGRLLDSGTGVPLVGPHTMTFRIYDAVSGGSLLWSETKVEEADSSGVFATVLGNVTSVDIAFEDPCWLEVEVDGEVLSPRRELVSVPYAFSAQNTGRASDADSLGGHSSGEFVLKGETSSITATMIVAGAGSGLDADMVDGWHANGFADTSHNHDGRYYTEGELNAGGTINQAGNPVDWTKLKNVPAGFADGVDNVGAGDGYSLDAADGSPTDVVYVNNDGNAGVGTTNPTLGKLQVMGSGSATGVYSSSDSGTGLFGFSSTGSGVTGTSPNGRAGSFVGNVYVSGDLGIGTASPTEKLDVAGDINLTGDIRVGGATAVSVAGSGNACLGIGAGYGSGGGGNTFIGYEAGLSSTTGGGNTFVGSQSGRLNTGGIANTFVGVGAGASNTTGFGNCFFGQAAGVATDSGGSNVFVGGQCGFENTSGSVNTFVGQGSGHENTTGEANTCLGAGAGFSNETGDSNTCLGTGAGHHNEGSRNVFVGFDAGAEETGSGKLYVANGPDAEDVLIYGDFAAGRLGLGTLNPERKLHIVGDGPRVLIEATTANPEVNFKLAGDLTSDIWAIYKHSITEDLRFYQNGDRVTFQSSTGNVAIGATDPAGYRLYVNGTAYATGGWQPSDLRLKADLRVIDDALGKVLRLNGISFRWRTEEHPDRGLPGGRHYGLVAQEVEQVLPEVVNAGPGGEKALAYSELIPVLIECVKELKAENEGLKQRIEALERAR